MNEILKKIPTPWHVASNSDSLRVCDIEDIHNDCVIEDCAPAVAQFVVDVVNAYALSQSKALITYDGETGSMTIDHSAGTIMRDCDTCGGQHPLRPTEDK